MGLSISHGTFDGPYSYFQLWRHAVAKAAGYRTCYMVYLGDPEMNGDVDTIQHPVTFEWIDIHPSIAIDWAHVTDAQLEGEWDETPDDPLMVLIAHYDHTGYIAPRDAAPLADRIEELKPALKEPGERAFRPYMETATYFVRGLRRAADAGERVVFT